MKTPPTHNVKKTGLLVFLVAAGWTVSLLAAEPGGLLKNGDFEAGEARALTDQAGPGVWFSPAKAAVKAGEGRNKSQCACLEKNAAVAQNVADLPAGIYELTAWARGRGRILLSDGLSKREMALGKDWHAYSLVFEVKQAGPAKVSIALVTTNGEAWIDDAALQPAAADRVEAWKKQEEVLVKMGYVPGHLSAQRPPPDVGEAVAAQPKPLPDAIGERVVFCDERYDGHWTDLMAVGGYFVDRGFRPLNAEEVGQWLAEKIKKGAYGTLCVFPSVLPSSVMSPKACDAILQFRSEKDDYRDTLIRRYMEAGGRVLWIGHITMLYTQFPTGPFRGIERPFASVLADVETDQRIFYGAPSQKSVLTPVGKTWGLTQAYMGLPVNRPDVTLSFCEAPEDNASFAFLKTINPEYPLSGLVSFPIIVDAKNTLMMDEILRAALFVGKPVQLPPAVERKIVVPDIELTFKLGGDLPRQAFLRGERIPVSVTVINRKEPFTGNVLLEFLDGDKPIFTQNVSLGAPTGESVLPEWSLATDRFAVGDYVLRARVDCSGAARAEKTCPVLLRRISDNPFFYGVWSDLPKNALRRKAIIDDLRGHNMEAVGGCADSAALLADGLRLAPRIEGPEGFPTGFDPKKEPELAREFARRDSDGNTSVNPWNPSRVNAGLAHPQLVRGRMEGTRRQIREALAWPNTYPWFITNDDFSSPHYRMDWSDYAKNLFKKATGLDAPLEKKDGSHLSRKGIVSEEDPWFQWNLFNHRDICGAYNVALGQAKNQVMPSARIGPVPGGMEMPVWQEGQYPPYSFGKNGFDLLAFYYYNIYWQPEIGYLYFDELARLGNRDLPLFPTGDCMCGGDEPGYYRNQFFLHLAGGAAGIEFFAYNSRVEEGWNELGRLGNIIKRLGPTLYQLKPARKSVGYFMPLAEFFCDYVYPTMGLYAFSNLLAAHIDAEPVCREELLAGRASQYDMIVTWKAEHISAQEAEALKAYAAKGGKVFLDGSSEVDIPGIPHLDIDLAMGADGKSKLETADARFGKPGIMDYQHPARIAAIKEQLSAAVKPPYDSPSSELVIRSFDGEGVRYLWLVNIHTREEYEYLRARLGAGVQVADKVAALNEAKAFLKQRGVYDKTFETTLTLPEGDYIVCDLLKQKELPLKPAEKGRRSCGVSMERLGGALLALYPAKVARLEAQVYPAKVKRGERAALEVCVSDTRKKLCAGLLPLHIEVFAPDGKTTRYETYAAARNGRYLFDFVPAVNEPAGNWKVKVTELGFGTVTEARLQVE